MAKICRFYRRGAGNDVTIATVPEGWIYQFLYGHNQCITTATGGKRQMNFSVYDENDLLIMNLTAGGEQLGSDVRHYGFLPGTASQADFVVAAIVQAVPHNLMMMEGWYLKIWDFNNRDPLDIFNVDAVFRCQRMSNVHINMD